MLRPFMKNFPQLGYKLQVTKKERIAIITSEALRRMQLEPSFPLKSLPALCFQLISIVAEPYLPHLEKNLNEDTVIQGLEIFDVLCLKKTNNVIFLENEMLLTVELHLSSCVLGVNDLGCYRDSDIDFVLPSPP
ncbi:hypothetical protein BRARA_C00962 [Brassica rapa]|uniref:Uncharacterized protein n=1 Tax=Brassica campestris TaxID=3711 RepID=A0A397ZUG3_BRACM|nr:hypothetical protein BRARA_C00962 [Brassica rapa]